MFGFQGGETVSTVARKRGFMLQARRHWPFMTHFDASTIRNETQLVTLVQDRGGGTRREAELAVAAWMVGRQF